MPCLFFLEKNFKRFYLFIFRERGTEGEREGEKHQCVVASRLPPAEDLVRNPGMCPDWESNQQLFGSQAHTTPARAHAAYFNKALSHGNTILSYLNIAQL